TPTLSLHDALPIFDRVANRVARALGSVNAADRLQLDIIERLHADAEPVDAERFPERNRVAADVLGIRLHREFGVVLRAELRTDCIDDALQMLRRCARWRPPAEIDGVDLFPSPC